LKKLGFEPITATHSSYVTSYFPTAKLYPIRTSRTGFSLPQRRLSRKNLSSFSDPSQRKVSKSLPGEEPFHSTQKTYSAAPPMATPPFGPVL
jgi:hypothetical protein